MLELASLLELVASGPGAAPVPAGGGDEAEVDVGVVEAGIRADEARNEWGIDDKTPQEAEGKWAPKGLGGGGGCCPERAAAVAACR